MLILAHGLDFCPFWIISTTKLLAKVNGDKLPIFLLVNVRTGPTFKLPQLFGSIIVWQQPIHSFCVFLAGATAFQRTHEGCLILMQSRQSAKFRIPWCVTVCVTCTLITALANIKIISNRTWTCCYTIIAASWCNRLSAECATSHGSTTGMIIMPLSGLGFAVKISSRALRNLDLHGRFVWTPWSL